MLQRDVFFVTPANSSANDIMRLLAEVRRLPRIQLDHSGLAGAYSALRLFEAPSTCKMGPVQPLPQSREARINKVSDVVI